ncbi:MAG: hypothetical protein H2069_07370 [Legionella sp.]|nr:hypothetical protein [Legionella sp.]
MESDRYQKNSKLFIIGIISLLFSLSLLAFSLYILPYLLWDLFYRVPAFVLNWREGIKNFYEISELGAAWIVFLIFIIPAVFFGYISYLTSNYIDDRIFNPAPLTTEKPEVEKKELRETFGWVFKILGMILLTLGILAIVEQII